MLSLHTCDRLPMEACVRHLRDGVVKEDGVPPMLLVCDDLSCTGGSDVLQQLCRDYADALGQQRAQAQHIVSVSLQGLELFPAHGSAPELPVSHVDAYSDPGGWLSSGALSTAVVQQGCHRHVVVQGKGGLATLLAAITNAAPPATTSLPRSSRTLCIVLDSLTPLLLHHSSAQVNRFMTQLLACPAVSCVLAGLQVDLHDSHAVAGLQRCASCLASLQAVPALLAQALSHTGQGRPHACLTFRYKARRTGRMRAESVLYQLAAAQRGVRTWAAPPHLAGVLTPEALVTLALRPAPSPHTSSAQGPLASSKQPGGPPPASHLLGGPLGTGSGGEAGVHPALGLQGQGHQGAGPGPPANVPGLGAPSTTVMGSQPVSWDPLSSRQPAGPGAGMRLEVTEAERRAREAVVLPYEHQGQAAAYHTGDWREYLPSAAGGTGNEQGRLGSLGADSRRHVRRQPQVETSEQPRPKLGSILYVRDSDEEQGGLHDSDEDPDDDLDL
ncbi:hypothetical protein V8C86DRAFT_2688399 [Haematococcus lacustris]